VFARLPALPREAANAVVIREIFCGTNVRAALPSLQAEVERWRPDLILREPAEFASYLVAERTGIPQVQAAISVATFDEFVRSVVDEPLRQFGSRHGAAGLLAAGLTLMPASLDASTRPAQRHGAEAALPGHVEEFRDQVPLGRAGGVRHPQVDQQPCRPPRGLDRRTGRPPTWSIPMTYLRALKGCPFAGTAGRQLGRL
jgi:hypothetical protein